MCYLYSIIITQTHTAMKYFLRFTDIAKEDLRRGTSLLDLPSLNKPVVLDGLCGYSFCDAEEIDYNMISEQEIINKVNMYQRNTYYEGAPVLFLGEYVSQNPNGEGVIFKAISIYRTF